MTRFDELRQLFGNWIDRQEDWDRLGREVPSKVLRAFVEYIGAPPPLERNGELRPYVDFYRLPEPNSPPTDYERVSSFEAAKKTDDGCWEFVLGITIDREKAWIPNVNLFTRIQFRRNGDSLSFSLPMQGADWFDIDAENSDTSKPMFDRMHAAIRSVLLHPDGPPPRAAIGFDITRTDK